MASVVLPTGLRARTGEIARIEVDARTVADVIAALDRRYPGMGALLADADGLLDGVAVAVNGETATMGLFEPIPEGAEVHFIPAISGG